jgi:hypothetical protein
MFPHLYYKTGTALTRVSISIGLKSHVIKSTDRQPAPKYRLRLLWYYIATV